MNPTRPADRDASPPRHRDRAPRSAGGSSTSWPVPCRRTCPFSSTTPCELRRRPALAFCSTSRIVRPVLFIWRTVWKTVFDVLGSRPIDGSSSTTSNGSSIRLRANSTRRCWPPDRLPAFSRARSATIGKSSSTAFKRCRTSTLSLRVYATDFHVFADRHVAEKAVVLRHQDDARRQDLPGRAPDQISAVEHDPALARLQHRPRSWPEGSTFPHRSGPTMQVIVPCGLRPGRPPGARRRPPYPATTPSTSSSAGAGGVGTGSSGCGRVQR